MFPRGLSEMTVIACKNIDRLLRASQFERECNGRLQAGPDVNNTDKKMTLSDRLQDKTRWNTLLSRALYFDKFTTNHSHAFLIDDGGQPWWRFKGHRRRVGARVGEERQTDCTDDDVVASNDYSDLSTWKPLFWTGYPFQYAESVHCDGANLCIVDNLGKVHYRKVLREKFQGPQEGNNTGDDNHRCLASPEQPHGGSSCFPRNASVGVESCTLAENRRQSLGESCKWDKTMKKKKKRSRQTTPHSTTTTYSCRDKIEETDFWSPGWALGVFPFHYYSSRLKLDVENNNSYWCLSHRGLFNRFLRDRENGCKVEEKMGPVPGCTTFFYCDGRHVFLADPMNLFGFSHRIDLPVLPILDDSVNRFNTRTTQPASRQKTYAIDSSASCLIYVCKTRRTGSWNCWMIFVDFDLLKKVPHVAYYARCATDWTKLPSLPVNDAQEVAAATLGGVKVHNLGNNTRLLQVWFQTSSSTPSSGIVKCSLLLPDDCFPRENTTWASHALQWKVARHVAR